MADELKKIEALWRKQNRLRFALEGFAIGFLFGSITSKLTDGWLPLLVGIGASLLYFLVRVSRFHPSPRAIAQYLNSFDEFEHSAELLLASPDDLSFLAQLQRQKITSRLQPQTARRYLPNAFSASLRLSATLIFFGVVVQFLPVFPPLNVDLQTHPNPIAPPNEPLRITSLSITISPPRYTRQTSRVVSNLNLQVPERARLDWKIETNRAVQVARLVFSSGDTLKLEPISDRAFQASRLARASDVYSLSLDSLVSDFAIVEVTPDSPPILNLISPEPRTVFNAPDAAQILVKTSASDDYGLRSLRLVTTLSKGKGESVKFASDTLRFESLKVLENGITLAQSPFNLKDLGLTYGDEFYFFVEATDNCEPAPNRVRSETVTVKIADSLQAESSESLALPVLRLPAYFRSQRQIIIDTEKLISEKKSIEAPIFKVRSENLGIDQKLLRLRYGKFLGEELALSIGDVQFEQTTKALRDTSKNPIVKLGAKAAARTPKVDDGHEHSETQPQTDNLSGLLEPYQHRHDIEEAATFFPEPVKRQLKATLAEMWEAEKYLRLHQPERALPYEYKALELLKDLQAQARVYVQKSGFEPVPINEAELRLTGDPAKIQSRSQSRRIQNPPAFPAIRASLPILARLRHAQTLSSKELADLEQAGRELASASLEKSGKYLFALQSLRQIILNSNLRRPSSLEQIVAVESAFLNLLPKATQTVQPTAQSGSILSKRYFNMFR